MPGDFVRKTKKRCLYLSVYSINILDRYLCDHKNDYIKVLALQDKSSTELPGRREREPGPTFGKQDLYTKGKSVMGDNGFYFCDFIPRGRNA